MPRRAGFGARLQGSFGAKNAPQDDNTVGDGLQGLKMRPSLRSRGTRARTPA